MCIRDRPNAFLEPSFAVAALQHFAFARRPTFLLIWEADGAAERGRLIGLCPVSYTHLDVYKRQPI